MSIVGALLHASCIMDVLYIQHPSHNSAYYMRYSVHPIIRGPRDDLKATDYRSVFFFIFYHDTVSEYRIQEEWAWIFNCTRNVIANVTNLQLTTAILHKIENTT